MMARAGALSPVEERGVRLSGLQRQLNRMARILYRTSKILGFDEATSTLDPESEEQVMEANRDLQGPRITVIVTYRISTVAHCDRLIRPEIERIVQTGPPDEVMVASSSN